ncbi:MAG: hypothetical protein KC636_09800, partial [Myxococcales bacterium]|nr:hypothetical protein [Myxococcales bacterium]
ECANDCTVNLCTPTGQRAPMNTLFNDSASGCWNGNPCTYDAWQWASGHGQNFQAFSQAISCRSNPQQSYCVQHVGVTTYSNNTVCQGLWEVLCDGFSVGMIDTNNKPGGCTGSAMTNGCRVDFLPRECAEIKLVAVSDGNNTGSCCGGSQPDSMLTGVSAW